jgi:transcriptional regulator with XRE-family HTH domain
LCKHEAFVKTLGSARHRGLIEVLVERRRALGLTQAEVARELGEYQSFVARYESGQRRIDVIEFLELAEILKFDAATVVRRLARMRE